MFKRNLLVIMFAPLLTVFAAYASSQPSIGCEVKRQEIQQQIEYANAHNNSHRVSGLQKALSELNANCTDEGLRAEREAKVREKTRKVEERRRELSEAKTDGRADKISKKQQKLTEAEVELSEAKTELTK
ncbi:DUF1090 domain-containing protein [Pantoea dispersa]|uniref:DUF1090 domain-containing protein n=1 Tax=Pantoea dispersa TaxID=59814 RepID=UPI002DBF16E9|nr:DUF1090 domain-containing protein [Pantoea dispersa]MEB5974925.1 DUF1090 domain-containing protein [Pantoea dispersa]